MFLIIILLTKDKDCLLPSRIGKCRGAIRAYYYNNLIMACAVFYYGGCDGNGNRFETMDMCKKNCMPANNEKIRTYYIQIK